MLMGDMIVIIKKLKSPHILLFHFQNAVPKYLQKIPMLFQLSTTLNGNNNLKEYIFGRNNSHRSVNKISKCRKFYYDKETPVMVYNRVNEFYICFLFKIDTLPQDVVFTLDISVTFFKKLSPNVIKLLIS